jgi:hypothetical protein
VCCVTNAGINTATIFVHNVGVVCTKHFRQIKLVTLKTRINNDFKLVNRYYSITNMVKHLTGKQKHSLHIIKSCTESYHTNMNKLAEMQEERDDIINTANEISNIDNIPQ